MRTVFHAANTRGGGDHGWLRTRHSFSFADWYDPKRMGFGKLRVLNDDVIEGGTGFGAHSHRDMEIITIVTQGSVKHSDSIGNTFEVPAGDVQVMSAGRGVTHAEVNASDTEPLALFQIWIETNTPHSEPKYAQKAFHLTDQLPGVTLLVSEEGGEAALSIQQDARISYAVLDAEHPLSYQLRSDKYGVYVFCVEGELEALGQELTDKDGFGVSDVETVTLSSKSRATLLLIEVPME